MYLMKDNLRWEMLEHIQTPRLRAAHCMVQINECEVALIGGKKYIGENAQLEFVSIIDVYNFEQETWREGPE